MTSDVSLICDHCSCILHPGRAEYYIINIEAMADPAPPAIEDDYINNSEQLSQQITRLFEQLKDLSAQEAMDQVSRRVMLQLCNRCYAEWIENPTGA